MCQLMAIEMGLLDAIVKQHGQSIDACTLTKEIQRDEVLIGQSIGAPLVCRIADDL